MPPSRVPAWTSKPTWKSPWCCSRCSGLVPPGLFIALPEGYEAQVRPRSGLAAKNGITVLNTPGTIDADYRGEVKVILVNLSDTPFEIVPGERIAQMVIARHEQVEWEEVEPSGRNPARSRRLWLHRKIIMSF